MVNNPNKDSLLYTSTNQATEFNDSDSPYKEGNTSGTVSIDNGSGISKPPLSTFWRVVLFFLFFFVCFVFVFVFYFIFYLFIFLFFFCFFLLSLFFFNLPHNVILSFNRSLCAILLIHEKSFL